MTKYELAKKITSKVPITNRTALEAVDIMFDEIKKEFDANGEIKIRNFKIKVVTK